MIKMQTAASTSTLIAITATPASRPGSEDDLVPGLLDELVALGEIDELAPVSVDSLGSAGSADGLSSSTHRQNFFFSMLLS